MMHPPVSAAAQPIPGFGGGRSFDRSGRHRGDDPETPTALSVSFEASTIRSDDVAVARVDCMGIRPDEVHCYAATPGFEIHVLEERALVEDRIILGLRIHRRIGAIRRLCLVRFAVRGMSATASITVLH